MDILIREAKHDDFEYILKIHYRAVHETLANDYEEAARDRWNQGVTPEAIRNWQRFFSTNETLDFVAIDSENKILGFSTLISKKNEVRAMYVSPEYQGKGVGKRLLEKMNLVAIENGLTHLSLHSTTIAHRFYESNGFETRVETRFETTHDMGGVKIPCFAMRKIISNAWIDPMPVLQTNRLILRPLRLSDAEAIYEYASDPDVSKFTLFETHQGLENAIGFIKTYAFPLYEKNLPEPYGITLVNGSDRVIGTVGCRWASEKFKSMELMYAMGKSYWGKGIMVEAARAVVKHVFDYFDVNRVQAHAKSENIASTRVMEKIGMEFEGEKKEVIFSKGRFWDAKFYGLLRRNSDSFNK